MYTNQFILNTDPDKITLIGDSAGWESGSSCFTDGKRSGRIPAEETDTDLSCGK